MNDSFQIMLKLAMDGAAGAAAAAAAASATPSTTPAAPAAKHRMLRIPSVKRDGVLDPALEQIRTLGQTDHLTQPPNSFMGVLADLGWNFFGPQVNPRAMMGSPYTSNPYTQWIPPQYQTGRQDAMRAAQTFRPYESGLTMPAQLLQTFAPQLQGLLPGMPFGAV
jgi:hypothetical protein